MRARRGRAAAWEEGDMEEVWRRAATWRGRATQRRRARQPKNIVEFRLGVRGDSFTTVR